MDKDIERLGRERLRRQRNRKNWSRTLIALAVIVLGITVYNLIQPASAEDKNKAEFTIDKESETYTNLNKLSNLPTTKMSGDGAAAWNGKDFDISVDLDFKITKEEAETSGNNYYFVFSDGVYISDNLCSKWHDHQDTNGKYAFSYHFVKTDDNKFAVVIKFKDGYIKNDVTAGIKFNCSAKGKIDGDGDVTIDIGGEAYVKVDSVDITWDKDTSVNYDIHVKKSTDTDGKVKSDENGNEYVDYVLKISSDKGTPDSVVIKDILKGNGIKVNVNNPVIKVTQNGGSEISQSKYTASVKQTGDGEYQLDATLPKLSKGDYYTVTYRYYLDTSGIANGETRTLENKVKVSSEDKDTHENVVDTSSCQAVYKKSNVSKSGKYKDGYIEWTITVNAGNANIAGKKLTDTMFSQCEDFSITSEQDKNCEGVVVNKNGNSVNSVEFKALSNGVNTSSYTITYKTKVSQSFSEQTVKNTVDFDGNKDVANVTVPGKGVVEKTLEKETDNTAEQKHIFIWKSVINIPDSGIQAGTKVTDELCTSKGTSDHYMTYVQVKNAFETLSTRFGYGNIGELIVKVKNFETSNYEWVSWDGLNQNSYKYFEGFQFTILNPIYSYNYGNSIEFTYESTGSYESGIDPTYRNTIKVGSVSSSAEYTRDSKVKKTDANGNEGKTESDGNEDGTVTWYVEAKLYNDTDKYIFTDNLPKGVTLQSLSVKIGWRGTPGFAVPSFDGTTYKVEDYGKYWDTAGISINTIVNNTAEGSVVTSTVNRIGFCNRWNENDCKSVFLEYVCKIDGYDQASNGTVYTLKNNVKVSTNKVEDFGEDWQTQIITKPGDKETGDDDKEHGTETLEKEYVWNNTDKLLNYTVTINPEGKDLVSGTDTLSLKDVVEYANMTYTGATETWEVHLVPTTVILYEAVKNEDGTLTATDKVVDWKWTYEEKKGLPHEKSYNTITGEVPDGKPLILKYSYSVNAVITGNVWGKTRLSITNAVSIVGVDSTKTDTGDNDKYLDDGTSAYIYTSDSYKFFKVEKDNFGKLLAGAEFTVYRYEPDKGGYVEHMKYITDENGEFTVQFNLKDYVYNQQYYVCETKAPKGYLLPDNPQKYYFYCNVDNTSTYPIKAADDKLQGADLSKEGYHIEYVEDEKLPVTSIGVEKTWKDSDGNTVIRKEGSIFLQLYQEAPNQEPVTYGNLIEVKPDKNGNWKYSVTELPKYVVDDNGNLTNNEYRYFFKETGVDEKYSMSGYKASYLYTDNSGHTYIIKDGDDPCRGIAGGMIEICNTSVAYELPETGGAGDRLWYMLSGMMLTMLAAIALIYRRNKNKIIN